MGAIDFRSKGVGIGQWQDNSSYIVLFMYIAVDVGSSSGIMWRSAVWGCVSLISVYLGSVLNHRKEVVWYGA